MRSSPSHSHIAVDDAASSPPHAASSSIDMVTLNMMAQPVESARHNHHSSHPSFTQHSRHQSQANGNPTPSSLLQIPVVIPVAHLNGTTNGDGTVTTTTYLTPMQLMFADEEIPSADQIILQNHQLPQPPSAAISTYNSNANGNGNGAFSHHPTKQVGSNGHSSHPSFHTTASNHSSHPSSNRHSFSRSHVLTEEEEQARAERLEQKETEKAAELYKSTQEGGGRNEREELTRGMKLLGLASAALAIMICVGGSVLLASNKEAIFMDRSFQCDQLFVWGLLFVIFEGFYLCGLFIHGCFSDESFHTKRVKSLILLVVFCMSVLFFIWGTIIINTSKCPENTFGNLWLFFRVLYWFIIGVWSVVLILLTLPIVLFFALKKWMSRNG